MKTETITVAFAAAAITTALAAEESTVDALIANIKSKDDKARGSAWQSADKLGAKAVVPLAEVMATSDDMEVARAAKRALWRIVRYAGRPKADAERKAVQKALTPLLASSANNVKREVLWMLSEIGDNDAVEPMAVLLKDQQLREDARQSLHRMPIKQALAALKKAFASAPEDFKYALAHSLRARGEKVAGYPSQRLTPTRQTSVKPATA
jgi:HEAT repeat protein